jgi:hypothetical protein
VYFSSSLLAGGSELRLCFFRDSRRLEFTFFRVGHGIPFELRDSLPP